MEPAQVVNAVDMVGMGVCKQDAVNLVNFLCEHLHAQIGGGVHQD